MLLEYNTLNPVKQTLYPVWRPTELAVVAAGNPDRPVDGVSTIGMFLTSAKVNTAIGYPSVSIEDEGRDPDCISLACLGTRQRFRDRGGENGEISWKCNAWGSSDSQNCLHINGTSCLFYTFLGCLCMLHGFVHSSLVGQFDSNRLHVPSCLYLDPFLMDYSTPFDCLNHQFYHFPPYPTLTDYSSSPPYPSLPYI
eukprot:Gb_37475 [translate_table: standard]